MPICCSLSFQATSCESSLYVLYTRVCACVRCSYIWAEGRVQHVGLQSLEVDVSEDGVLLDLCGPSTLAAQSLLGVLGQELIRSRRKRKRQRGFKKA